MKKLFQSSWGEENQGKVRVLREPRERSETIMREKKLAQERKKTAEETLSFLDGSNDTKNAIEGGRGTLTQCQGGK